MNVTTIKDGIVSGITTAFNATKNAVIWSGHKVSSGFTNYVVPAVKTVWDYALIGLSKLFAFLRTGYGLAAVGITTGAAFMVKAERLTGDENWGLRVALRTAAVGCFILGGAALMVGAASVI